MKRLGVMIVLGLAAAVALNGCMMIAWKGTEAATGAVPAPQPGQGPVLTAAQQAARDTHNAMKKVAAAEEAALRKVKDAVIK